MHLDKEIYEGYHTCNHRRLYCKYSRHVTPSVILITGMGDSCDTWNEVQERIAQETSTFSYDRAELGKSQDAPVPRTCLDLVARLYASLYPHTIFGMILVDAAPEYKELEYEKVLSGKLAAKNREYYENPMRNSEKIDKIKSYQQIVDHTGHGSYPLSIIIRGLPDEGSADWPSQDILEIEQKLQADFERLSTASKVRVATNSGHYIHHDEPEIVIEEILMMVRGWRDL
ncbi:alpha/beta hydrolase [Paenibacillus sp. L3-i20]|uniref:alpha/beta hydrolase n=1 Tax=Paenibacillus sp. L3-i20 TaxID=2905833 RepID=UPI001EDE343A|nr:alpha/beta hydrolase [Paenibacillus sp. L3-i20]GKU76562.1 hypothetical protein L3i20_v209590 [Paenibacillus sp. L3-i20]